MKTTLRALGLFSVIGFATIIASIDSSEAVAAEGANGVEFIVPTVDAQRPVLDYDVTGGTLAGPFHYRLSVYDNGHASISMSEESWIIVPNEECPSNGRATHTGVTLEEVEQLRADLIAAGAFKASNGGQLVDTPVQSVTVYVKRGAHQLAHSFSFQMANSPEIVATLEVINAFIDKHFPEF